MTWMIEGARHIVDILSAHWESRNVSGGENLGKFAQVWSWLLLGSRLFWVQGLGSGQDFSGLF